MSNNLNHSFSSLARRLMLGHASSSLAQAMDFMWSAGSLMSGPPPKSTAKSSHKQNLRKTLKKNKRMK